MYLLQSLTNVLCLHLLLLRRTAQMIIITITNTEEMDVVDLASSDPEQHPPQTMPSVIHSHQMVLHAVLLEVIALRLLHHHVLV